jgi:SagB-type dehydrogenase family enzyme
MFRLLKNCFPKARVFHSFNNDETHLLFRVFRVFRGPNFIGYFPEAIMDEALYDTLDPAELYHENSKLRRIDQEHFSWITFVGAAQSIRETLAKPFRTFRGKPRVRLTSPEDCPASGMAFEDIVRNRVSVREFEGPVTADQVAGILHSGYGVTRPAADGEALPEYRATPSAGALYPLEIYLFAFDIDGLSPGLYHYAVREHSLEQLVAGGFKKQLSEITMAGDILAGAGGLVIISGVFGRTRFKYGKQAYRFVLFEAGHVSQNLMLAATSLSLGSVAIGGFIDDELNSLLGMDGVNEAALYLLAFGNPKIDRPGGQNVPSA